MSQDSQTKPPPHPGSVVDPARQILTLAQDHPGPHRYPWHRHFRAQLVYASVGIMTVGTADGTWLVPPQQAVWMPAGIEHEVASPGSLSMRSLYLHPASTAGLPTSCCVFTVSPLLRELILRAVSFPANYPAEGPEARLIALIPDELRASTPEPLHLPLPLDARLRVVTDALTADPANDRPLAVWAKAAGASERTLARLFQKETGMSFGTWRQRLRLLSAIGRLAKGHAVTTVAYDLGYESPSAFIAMFRRNLGATPGRYLASAR